MAFVCHGVCPGQRDTDGTPRLIGPGVVVSTREEVIRMTPFEYVLLGVAILVGYLGAIVATRLERLRAP